jgi:hypothetical protein
MAGRSSQDDDQMSSRYEIIIVRPSGHNGALVFAAMIAFLALALFAGNSPASLSEEEVLAKAFQEGQAAAYECRARRLSGEILTFVQSAQCSNGRIIEAFRKVNYKYMDLINRYAAGRLQIAERTDRGFITEAEAQAETGVLIKAINEAARQRDSATFKKIELK